MATKLIVANISGTHSLLQNNPLSMQPVERGLGTKHIPSPEEEAAGKIYKTDDGILFVPAIAFKASCVNALKGKRIGKVGAPGRFKSAVFPADVQCPLFHPKTKKPLKANQYNIHTTRCVIKTAGVLRSRPEIKQWATKVAFEYEDDLIGVDVIKEAFEIAGRIVGVGDWRPERGGPHGRFTVTF